MGSIDVRETSRLSPYKSQGHITDKMVVQVNGMVWWIPCMWTTLNGVFEAGHSSPWYNSGHEDPQGDLRTAPLKEG